LREAEVASFVVLASQRGDPQDCRVDERKVTKLSNYAHCQYSRLLSQHRLSNNVGVVNHYWRTLQHALDEERHFALAEEVPIQPPPGSQENCRS
jgi:hypothetical protein